LEVMVRVFLVTFFSAGIRVEQRSSSTNKCCFRPFLVMIYREMYFRNGAPNDLCCKILKLKKKKSMRVLALSVANSKNYVKYGTDLKIVAFESMKRDTIQKFRFLVESS